MSISPETWDRWVEDGILPSPAPGLPSSTPRWFWPDVEQKVRKEPDMIKIDPFMVGVEELKNGSPKKT